MSTYRDQTGIKLVASRSGISTDPTGTSGSATAQFVVPRIREWPIRPTRPSVDSQVYATPCSIGAIAKPGLKGLPLVAPSNARRTDARAFRGFRAWHHLSVSVKPIKVYAAPDEPLQVSLPVSASR